MEEPLDIWQQGHEVEELLGREPGWLTRWGLLVLFLLFALLLSGSWLIQYPDVLRSPVVITSDKPPAALIARADGKIASLFATDRQLVKKGAVLMLIENPANYDDIRALASLLDHLQPDSSQLTAWVSGMQDENWLLGEVTPSYSNFLEAVTAHEQFQRLKEHPAKVKALQEEVKMTTVYINQLKGQVKTLEKDVRLARKQYARDSTLQAREALAPSEFEQTESLYLQRRFAREGAGVSLANARIQLAQLQKDILDVSLAYRQQNSELLHSVERAALALKNSIETWKQRYLLISPVDGQLAFHQYWSVNQQVKAGDHVLTVMQPGDSRMYAQIMLTPEGAGKVKPGQQVNIKLADYPFLEYGMVKGIVQAKSLLPQNKQYVVEVGLPRGLQTTYSKTLEYQQDMTGTAEIVTEDARLLERLVNPIRHLLRKNKST